MLQRLRRMLGDVSEDEAFQLARLYLVVEAEGENDPLIDTCNNLALQVVKDLLLLSAGPMQMKDTVRAICRHMGQQVVDTWEFPVLCGQDRYDLQAQIDAYLRDNEDRAVVVVAPLPGVRKWIEGYQCFGFHGVERGSLLKLHPGSLRCFQMA